MLEWPCHVSFTGIVSSVVCLFTGNVSYLRNTRQSNELLHWLIAPESFQRECQRFLHQPVVCRRQCDSSIFGGIVLMSMRYSRSRRVNSGRVPGAVCTAASVLGRGCVADQRARPHPSLLPLGAAPRLPLPQLQLRCDRSFTFPLSLNRIDINSQGGTCRGQMASKYSQRKKRSIGRWYISPYKRKL
jgi:hypothetical protein